MVNALNWRVVSQFLFYAIVYQAANPRYAYRSYIKLHVYLVIYSSHSLVFMTVVIRKCTHGLWLQGLN